MTTQTMTANKRLMTHVVISQPGAPEVLQLQQTGIPVPKADEVLVKVYAAGVNRPDVLQRKGLYPMPPGVTPVPGLEVAGIVVAPGDQVSQFDIGHKVCGLANGGGYAEYCVLPASQTLPMPKGLSFVQAAAIPETFFTVWANLFQMAQAKAGDTVLIHGGASGIGTTALMLCQALGITAFATAGSADKCAAIAHLCTAINYREQDFEQVILEATGQRGVDIILDIVGAPYFSKNLNVLARDGRLVIIGFMGGATVKEVDIMQVMLKRAVITGSTMRARTSAEKAEIAQNLQKHVWPLLASGKCLPMIHHVFDFKDVVQAHQMMEQDKHVGKIVLQLKAD